MDQPTSVTVSTSGQPALIGACIDQISQRALATAAAGPTAALLLAIVARGEVAGDTIALWLLLMIAASVADTAVLVAYRNRRRRVREPLQLCRWPVDQLVTTAVLGVAWAAAPFVLHGHHNALHLVVYSFLIGCGATAIAMSAAPVRYFLAFQIPICLSLAAAELVHREPWSLPLALGALLYLAITSELARQVRTWSINAIRIQLDNDRLVSELQHQATHDPLTGLANRTLFHQHLHTLTNSPERASSPFAVIYLDIDDFKDVNDRYGHTIGDELLCAIGQRLQERVRPTDLVARVAGDEYTILLTPLHDPTIVVAIAERIREHLARPYELTGTTVAISASLGTAIDDPTLTPTELVALADTALYHAKHAGKNRTASTRADRASGQRPGPHPGLHGCVRSHGAAAPTEDHEDATTGAAPRR